MHLLYVYYVKGGVIIFNEIKRSIFNKRFFIIVAIIAILIIIVCYFNGSWKGYLNFDFAEDIVDKGSPEAISFKNKLGNVFGLWNDSVYTFKVILPILLSFPFMHTFIEEKTKRYRQYMLSRKTYKQYMFDKIFSIIFSCTLAILLGQFLGFAFIACFASHDNSPRMLEGIFHFTQYQQLFLESPYIYSAFQLLLQTIYVVCFQVFVLGIASFLKQNIYVYVVPFLTHLLLSVFAPDGYRLTGIYDMDNAHFSFFTFGIMMCFLVVSGVSMVIYNEKKWKQFG